MTSKDLLIAGGWIVAVAGWLVGNYQANRREKRKETRTEIDACCKMAAEILVKCRVYYGTLADDPLDASRSADIRFEVQRLFIRAERLQNKYAKFEVIGACEELLDSSSGDQFESKERPVFAANSNLLLKIESDIHFLIDRLEDGFAKEFT